jgi:hypothetical protein
VTNEVFQTFSDYQGQVWNRSDYPPLGYFQGYPDFWTQWTGQNPVNPTITPDSRITLSTDYISGTTGTAVTLRAHAGQNDVATTATYFKRLSRLKNRTISGSVIYKNFDTLSEITSATLIASTSSATVVSRDLAAPQIDVVKEYWDSEVHLPEYLRSWKYTATARASTYAYLMDIAQTSSFTTSTTSTVSIKVAGYNGPRVTSTNTYNLRFNPQNTVVLTGSTATVLLFSGVLNIPAPNLQLNLDYLLTLPSVEYPGLTEPPSGLLNPPYPSSGPYYNYTLSFKVERWTTNGLTLLETQIINYDGNTFRGFSRPVITTRKVGRTNSAFDTTTSITSGTSLIKVYHVIIADSGTPLRRNSAVSHNVKAIRLTSQTGPNKFDLTTLYSA